MRWEHSGQRECPLRTSQLMTAKKAIPDMLYNLLARLSGYYKDIAAGWEKG